MRFFWVLFVCVLLPLQASWAARLDFSLPGNTPKAQATAQATAHHHDHGAAALTGTNTADHKLLAAGEPDCSACHAGCAALLDACPAFHAFSGTSMPLVTGEVVRAAPPRAPPDRPKWPTLA